MADQTAVEPIPTPDGPANVIETEYEVGQDNINPLGLDIHNPVFVISAFGIVAFVAATLANPSAAQGVFEAMRGFLTTNFDWFFLSAGNVFVLVCLALIVLPYGSVRIGGRDATPDYGYVGWFAMLFAAGMGIGLMFYG
ncbi:MAG: BCCT family transporter, partial [Pseudomonadota bacterium]